jgi:hypothetical protein
MATTISRTGASDVTVSPTTTSRHSRRRVYYSIQLFLLGAEFTKLYANRHGSKQKTDD